MIDETNVERKLEAITSLATDWRWKEALEVINYYQYVLQTELFSKKFYALTPEQKDKEHAGIVRACKALDFVKDMPGWLSKRLVRRWDVAHDQKILNLMIEREAKNGRRRKSS